jgi:DNA-directed RNA polymerase subunit RPC12/RpoP
MCRYALTNYKPHYACFACRKQFRRRLRRDQPHLADRPDQPARCPQCRLLMADMGLDFKPPPKDDEKAWQVAAQLWEVGLTFHSCGCGGPGYRPRDPREYRRFLEHTLDDYKGTLRHWMDDDTQKTAKQRQNQKDAIETWRHRIARLEAALAV